MPRSIVFQFGDRDRKFAMHKLDRTKLYGSKDLEVLDESDEPCELVTLAEDGRTLIGRGGTGQGYLTADGHWCDKAALTPVNLDGELIEEIPSSFAAPIKLFETTNSADLIDHNIRLVYHLRTEDDIEDLMDQLRRGTIFCFDFSYRGGLEADAAFMLLSDDGALFMLVGTPTKVDMIGLPQSAALSDELPNDDDLMDFDMI